MPILCRICEISRLFIQCQVCPLKLPFKQKIPELFKIKVVVADDLKNKYDIQIP